MSGDDHREVHVKWVHREADIDEDIAELVLECWKNGIDTLFSCQGDPSESPVRRAWVAFPHSDLERFLGVAVGPYDPDWSLDSIYNRALGHVAPPDGNEPSLEGWQAWHGACGWDYSVHVRDAFDPDEPVDAEDPPPWIQTAISVRFPFTDLDEVVRRLREARKDKSAQS
jgi:hypothetical protein